MREFIRQNRPELVASIRSQCDNLGKLTNDDIEDWIANDESLYNWARSAGVAV
jgi:hypothetical protein